MTHKIKKILKKSKHIMYARAKYRIWRNKRLAKKDDFTFLSELYRKEMGFDINWKNPQRITEKFQWLKMFYRHPDMPICADKYAVRSYLEKRGYGHLLNELYGVWYDPDEIDIDALPEKFVLKASHGSGMGIVCTDKSKIDWKYQKKMMKLWLQTDISVDAREWCYSDIRPCIICERYLENQTHDLIDYKFTQSFDTPLDLLIISERYTSDKHYLTYYSMDFEKRDFTRKGYTIGDEEKPSCFEEMKRLAYELGREFPLVRVDFYEVNGKVYFGEFTFFSGRGLMRFSKDEMDAHFGSMVTLPEPNYNLALFRRITEGEYSNN